MRSLSRAVVAGALALPMTFAGAGLAAACPDKADGNHHHKGDNHSKHEKHTKWSWGWKWNQVNVSDNDKSVINAGIIG